MLATVRSTVAARHVAAAGLAAVGLGASAGAAAAASFLGGLTTTAPVASTVPASGDMNPYGVAVVHALGAVRRGDVLVSNFNAKSNLQGTGTTIVQIAAGAARGRVFATVTPAMVRVAAPAASG